MHEEEKTMIQPGAGQLSLQPEAESPSRLIHSISFHTPPPLSSQNRTMGLDSRRLCLPVGRSGFPNCPLADKAENRDLTAPIVFSGGLSLILFVFFHINKKCHFKAKNVIFCTKNCVL